MGVARPFLRVGGSPRGGRGRNSFSPHLRASGVPPTKRPATKPAAKESRDWRDEPIALVRKLIREADPAVVEGVEWRKPSTPAGVPVWSRDGMICTGETYTERVRPAFAKGAFLADPDRLFDSGLAGQLRRAIDLRAGDALDARAFRALIREAIAFNQAQLPKSRRPSGGGQKDADEKGEGEGESEGGPTLLPSTLHPSVVLPFCDPTPSIAHPLRSSAWTAARGSQGRASRRGTAGGRSRSRPRGRDAPPGAAIFFCGVYRRCLTHTGVDRLLQAGRDHVVGVA